MVCAMKYAPTEGVALDMAQDQLAGGERRPNDVRCPAILAYIKQRWGY